MTERDHQDGACADVRRQMNAHLDGELSEQTNLEFVRHLSGCASCKDELQVRSRLKQMVRKAVRDTEMPADLEGRIRDAVAAQRAGHKRNWHQWSGRIAAGIALLTILGAGGWQWKRAHDQENMVRSLSSQIAQVFRSGFGDHLHCAVIRETKHQLVQAFIERVLVEPLGPEYQQVRQIVDEQRPAGLEVWMAHRCEHRNRKFVHVALRGNGKVLSVILTRKEPGEAFAGSESRHEVIEGDLALYATAVEDFQLTGFESAGHMVFVVSNLSAAENSETAAALGPSLDHFLKAGSA